MINSRAIADVQETHSYPNFLFESNHDKADNQIGISHEHLIQINNDVAWNNSGSNLTQNDELDHIHVLLIAAESLDIRSK